MTRTATLFAAVAAALAVVTAFAATPAVARDGEATSVQLAQAQGQPRPGNAQQPRPGNAQPQRGQAQGRGGRPNQPSQQAAPSSPNQPAGLETTAKQAIIVDFQTGAVLFEKNADERVPPSSMSKIMSAYLVFKALKEGRLKLDDTLPVSERAWRMQGSKMFVPLGGRVKVEDLLRGMIIQSGNDACIVLAEGLAGTEDAFAELLNAEARNIGLTDSNFRNSSGWPDPDHYMSARDLARLSIRLIRDFPDYYKYYSEKDFTYGTDARGQPIRQGNRNPLLYKSGGADGIKTGHTDQAGYGLTASAVREGGRRVVMALNGMPSMKNRAEESERLMDWAFREFQNVTVARAGQQVDRAEVWLGEKQFVPLVGDTDLVITLPRRLRQQVKVTIAFDAPVPAPIKKGAALGSINVSAPGVDIPPLPLVAGEDVARLGFGSRIGAKVVHLLFGAASAANGSTPAAGASAPPKK